MRFWSRNFWILVDEIGHSETKRTCRGILNEAILPLQKSISSCLGSLLPRLQLDERGRNLDQAAIGNADNLCQLHRIVLLQAVLDLDRSHVFTTDLEHIAQPAMKHQLPVVVDGDQVAGVEPAIVVQRLGRFLR